MEPDPSPMTFIVRVTAADDGAFRGVVERPRTGEKQRFQNLEALGGLIALMIKKATKAAAEQ